MLFNTLYHCSRLPRGSKRSFSGIRRKTEITVIWLARPFQGLGNKKNLVSITNSLSRGNFLPPNFGLLSPKVELKYGVSCSQSGIRFCLWGDLILEKRPELPNFTVPRCMAHTARRVHDQIPIHDYYPNSTLLLRIIIMQLWLNTTSLRIQYKTKTEIKYVRTKYKAK